MQQLMLNNFSKKISILALDRIMDMREIRLDYIPNTCIDLDEYFKDIIGVTRANTPKEIIRLKFSEHRFPYIETKPIHNSQRTIDHRNRIIEIEVIPNKELISEILSYGIDVEVLSPQHLGGQIASILKGAINKY